MAKQKNISLEEIEAKKNDFMNLIQKSKNDAKKGRVSSKTVILEQMHDVIKDAYDNGVSFRQISKDIEDVFGVKVSETTIRLFAQRVGIATHKKRNSATAGNSNKVFSTSSQIKEDMATKKTESNEEPTL